MYPIVDENNKCVDKMRSSFCAGLHLSKEGSFILILVGYGYFMICLFSKPLGSMCHARTFIPRQNCLGINVIHNGIDPNYNFDRQHFFHLDIPTKFQYLNDSTILLSMSRFNMTYVKSKSKKILIPPFLLIIIITKTHKSN